MLNRENVKCLYVLQQWSVDYGPEAKSDPPPAFEDMILLESHTAQSLTYCVRLLLWCSGRTDY